MNTDPLSAYSGCRIIHHSNPLRQVLSGIVLVEHNNTNKNDDTPRSEHQKGAFFEADYAKGQFPEETRGPDRPGRDICVFRSRYRKAMVATVIRAS